MAAKIMAYGMASKRKAGGEHINSVAKMAAMAAIKRHRKKIKAWHGMAKIMATCEKKRKVKAGGNRRHGEGVVISVTWAVISGRR